MRLCLNMIVRNEADKIERCLRSAMPHIHCGVICDTGSTDGTPGIIHRVFEEWGKPLHLFYEPFNNWEQARNAALKHAQVAKEEFDYILLMDADMELVVDNPKVFGHLDGIAYDMTQKGGTLVYNNRRLLKKEAAAKYRGVTHEYLDVPSAGLLDGAWFKDHMSGSNRPGKAQRDIDLLLEGLKNEPENGRYWFYLAQSYRDQRDWVKSAQAYKRRVDIGGWDQEVWYSQMQYANMLKMCGDEKAFVYEMLKAHEMRPSRSESLFELTKHFRLKGMNNIATTLADEGMDIPLSDDGLFVDSFPYEYGFREEFSIAGFYTRHRPYAAKVCSYLSIQKGVPEPQRACATNNLFHYVEPVRKHLRSALFYPIEFKAPSGYAAMNPSIMYDGGALVGIMRTVNYKIDAYGRYEILGKDGTYCDSHPIDTRNFIFEMSATGDVLASSEILPDPNDQIKWDGVTGHEDCRLFRTENDYRVVACRRDLSERGICQQVLSTIRKDDAGGNPRFSVDRVMKAEPELFEKNWMPIWVDDKLHFVYRMDTLIDPDGTKTVLPAFQDYDVSRISGGSQMIPFLDGYLGIVHEAGVRPDGQRYYRHRFAWYNGDLEFGNLSDPFVLLDKQIEFAAGIAHWNGKVFISAGIRDAQPWLISFDDSEVAEFVVP